MIKTIGKNRKKYIKQIFEKVLCCSAYTLENGFTGEEVSKEWVEGELWKFRFSKLRFDEETGVYTVDIHSNCWYEFESD